MDHNVDGVLPMGADFGINNVANGETSLLPVIEIIGVNFDEELFISDEWLQMMQHKYLIDMLLFGEKNPLVSPNQVEENLFADAGVENQVYETSAKSKKEEEDKTALSPKHNEQNQYGFEDVFYINLILILCVQMLEAIGMKQQNLKGIKVP